MRISDWSSDVCSSDLGVLAAAALRCIGGQFQGRLVFRNDDERQRAARCGITDYDRKYKLHELASGDVTFAASGVTDGSMLRGVRRYHGGATTHSRSEEHTSELQSLMRISYAVFC